MNGWMNEWMNEWVSEWVSEWMNEWMNEWKHEFDGWTEKKFPWNCSTIKLFLKLGVINIHDMNIEKMQ